MTATRDELAGVVDLFGATTRAELLSALEELAFKRGLDADEDALDAAIESALADYYLVAYEPPGAGGVGNGEDGADGEDGGEENGDVTELLAVGPTAFPSLPPNAEDLPHILDVPDREVDRGALGEAVRERLAEEAAAAAEAGDERRANELVDVSYDLEAWAPVEADGVRERLAAVLQD